MFARGNTFAQGDAVEVATYLGLPLLCLLAFIAIRYRRAGIVQLFGLVAVGAWSVTLGTALYVGDLGHPRVPLPYQLIVHIPLLKSGLDVRYAFIMDLAVSVVLAVGLDRLRQDGLFVGTEGWRRRMASPAARTGVCLGLAVVGLVPLVPRLPYASTEFGVPAVFTAKGSPIADGDVVLAYPLPASYADYSNDQTMLWQAEAGMRFKLIGFRGALAGKDHRPVTGQAALLVPSTAEDLLIWGIYGQPSPPPNDAATSEAVRQFLVRYHVDDVVLYPWNGTVPPVLRYFLAALGVRPLDFQGTFVWSHVPQLLDRRAS
jgi:hypothetical protein